MPKFAYRAVTWSGETLEGEMDAPARQIVIEHLQQSGHFPIDAQELEATRSPSLFALSRRTVSARAVSILTRELATMLSAGLPLDKAVETLVKLTQPGLERQMLERIGTALHGGSTLSDALAQQGGSFDRFYINMVKAGEAAGALEMVLERLADYQERSRELSESVKSALIYPLILVVVATASLMVLLIAVIPKFTPLFQDMGQALPLSTQIVIGVAEFLQAYWWLLLAALIATVLYLRGQFADPDSRYRWDRWLLRVPLLSGLLSKIEIARFARTLGTLLGNGVPLLTSVGIIKETLNNQVLNRAMDGVATSLEQGRGLAQPLEEADCFPELAIQLIRVGEETGQLEPMLLKLADVYDNEVAAAVKRALAVLEPALILGMGLVIATIIISILLAILGLNELVI